MSKKARIAVLVSGGGTNLQAILDASARGEIPDGEITLVVSDRLGTYAMERAVKGISHITGGGFYENIPRSIPDGLGARIEKSKIRILPIFSLIAEKGGISERDMFNTYNMGVGMSVIVSKEDADRALAVLRENGEDAYVMGEVVSGDDGVILA